METIKRVLITDAAKEVIDTLRKRFGSETDVFNSKW